MPSRRDIGGLQMRLATAASLIALCLAPHAQLVAQAPAPAVADSAVADGAIDVAGGIAALMVPPGWTRSTKGGADVITAPEGDVTIAIARIAGAASGDAAAAQAWKGFMPAFARPVQLAQDAPGRDGWDATRIVTYDVPPAENRAVQAIALKTGADHVVVLVDGSIATLSKRGGQLGQMFGSLRPKGFAKESFAGKAAHRLDAARIAQIRSFTEQAMKDLKVPGVGLALIDRNRIVWEGGIGVKDMATGAPVGKDTAFMVASNTKGMATLLLATLVDEGKLDWDKPVTDYMPSFRLGSAETTKKVLVKHLVCACTGLPRKDMEWLFNTVATAPASDTFVQLAATEPTSDFGEVFQYNNLMASAAGYLAAHVLYPGMELGAAYDRAMDERVFRPLGMMRTTHDGAKAMTGDWAKPYSAGLDGKPGLVDQQWNANVHPFRPAGGAWSSAHDMARYVISELQSGVGPDGKRVVSAKSLLARRARNVPTGENVWYGMGLFDDTSNGVQIVSHGGSMFGYKSNWYALPEPGVGLVVLTNSDSGQALMGAVRRKLLEVLYDGKPEAADNVASIAKRTAEAEAKLRADVILPVPGAERTMLVGRYSNAALGPMTIEDKRGRLYMSAVSLASEIGISRNTDGTFSIASISPGLVGDDLLVATKRDGKDVVVLNDGQHEYVWVKQ